MTNMTIMMMIAVSVCFATFSSSLKVKSEFRVSKMYMWPILHIFSLFLLLVREWLILSQIFRQTLGCWEKTATTQK